MIDISTFQKWTEGSIGWAGLDIWKRNRKSLSFWWWIWSFTFMPPAAFEKNKNVFQETKAGKHFVTLSHINNSLLIDSRVAPETGVPSCNTGWCPAESDNGMDIYSHSPLQVMRKRWPKVLSIHLEINPGWIFKRPMCTVPSIFQIKMKNLSL